MQALQPPASVTTALVVGGQDFDVALFSQVAGRSPTKIWRQKIPQLQNNPKLAQLEWQYGLAKRPHWSLDGAIREILELFEERREQIVAFVKNNRCFLHLWIQLHGDSTVIEYRIEGPTIEWLAAFGGSLSFSVDT